MDLRAGQRKREKSADVPIKVLASMSPVVIVISDYLLLGRQRKRLDRPSFVHEVIRGRLLLGRETTSVNRQNRIPRRACGLRAPDRQYAVFGLRQEADQGWRAPSAFIAFTSQMI
jgi:hypothetical protein